MVLSNNKNTEQSVLFLTDRVFWPANDGHKVVLFNYCKGLVEEYGCKIHVLTFLEPGQSADAIDSPPSFISSVEMLDKPSKIGIIRNLLSLFLPGSADRPAQCSLFMSKKACARLKATVDKICPSHVFIDLPRLAPYIGCIRDASCKKVLYLEDLFSKRYGRQLKSIDSLSKTGGVAGKYSANAKGALAWVASNKLLEKAVLRFESSRMRRMELNVVHDFNYVVLVSPKEAAILARETGTQNVIAIPLGVDCSFYTVGPNVDERDGVLSFLGDMRSSANADSLRYIVNEVLPLVNHEVALEVTGTAPRELQEEFADDKRVRFLGRVEDTRETLRSSSVFLAPIAYGTGIKTKILEAMAIGVPIVTNSIGNEGIGLVDGSNALIDDSSKALAQDVDRLLDDRELARKLAASARNKAIQEFDWPKSLAKFESLGFTRVAEQQ